MRLVKGLYPFSGNFPVASRKGVSVTFLKRRRVFRACGPLGEAGGEVLCKKDYGNVLCKFNACFGKGIFCLTFAPKGSIIEKICGETAEREQVTQGTALFREPRLVESGRRPGANGPREGGLERALCPSMARRVPR